MKKCQIPTTFFFADVNDKTVQQTLRALQNAGSADRVLSRQIKAKPGGVSCKRRSRSFLKLLGSAAPPEPGTIDMRPGPCYSLQKKAG